MSIVQSSLSSLPPSCVGWLASWHLSLRGRVLALWCLRRPTYVFVAVTIAADCRISLERIALLLRISLGVTSAFCQSVISAWALGCTLYPVSGMTFSILLVLPVTGRTLVVHIPPGATFGSLLNQLELPFASCCVPFVNGRQVALTDNAELWCAEVMRLRLFPLRGGGKANVKADMKQLLRSKGVEENKLDDRVSSILAGLSHDKVVHCLQSPDAWASLKDEATRAHVRLVFPAELKALQLKKRQESRDSRREGPACVASCCGHSPTGFGTPYR